MAALYEVLVNARLKQCGTVQRDQRHDVAEVARAELHDQVSATRGLELEHAVGVARAELIVGLRIGEVGLLDVEVGIVVRAHAGRRVVDDGERTQPEEVELHEADLLGHPPVVLDEYLLGLGIAVQRRQLEQGARRDHQPGRVLVSNS